jgi:S1-C subfamily serine protease
MQLTIRSGPDAGKTVQAQGNEFTIGRDASCDLTLNDGKASRRHAALRVLPDGRATLYDLGSSNGTYVNGQRVQTTLLSGGEQVQIGDTVLSPAPAAQPAATSAGQAAAVAAAAPPPAPQAPPPGPPTQAHAPTQAPPTQPLGGFPPPNTSPISRPSRTQSAIQRIMLQRAVNRATIIGIVAIVLVVAVGVLALLGVFSSDAPKTASNADIVEDVKDSTFFVVTFKGDSAGRGTGWVWDAKQGLIVTNAHVTAGGASWSVATGDHLKIEVVGQGTPDANVVAGPNGKDAKLLGQANCEDIAVLKVDPAGLVDLPRGTQGELRIGDRAVAVGYPSTQNTTTSDVFMEPGFTSGDLTATSGDVAQVQTTFGAIPGEGPDDPEIGPYQNVILTDTVINKGNSGGPLVNEDSELIGMNSAGRTDIVGQNYAVGVDRIEQIVPQLLGGMDVCGDGEGPLAGT